MTLTSTRERVQRACVQLSRDLEGVVATIVATADGLAVYTNWNEVEGMRAAAISATALGLGNRIAEDFGNGEFSDSVVFTTDRVIGIYAVGDSHVLGVVATLDLSLGVLHRGSRRLAKRLSQVLGSGAADA